MINAKYGQNELNVKVEINAKAEEYADGRFRVAVENVKFLAENDNHAQMNVPGTFMYYYVSKEDAKMLNDALDARADKNKPVTFKASVIKLNLVGSEYQLDLKEEVK